jgi:hypothetical protein
MERLSEIISEKERPWRVREALEILLTENRLNREYDEAADILGCSGSTVRKWEDDLQVGVPMPRQEFGGGKICRRCGENETPQNPRNDLCNECIDYVRAQNSGTEWEITFSEAVDLADNIENG